MSLNIIVSIELGTCGDVEVPEVYDSLARLEDLIELASGEFAEVKVRNVERNYYDGEGLIDNFDKLVQLDSMWWFVQNALRDFQALLNIHLDRRVTVLIA